MPGATIGHSTRGALACLLAVALLASGAAATGGVGAAPRAAAAEPPDDPLIAELVTAGQGGTRIDTEPATGAVSFVGFPAGTAWRPGSDGGTSARADAGPVAAAERFVARFAPLFGGRAEQLRAAGREPRPQGGWTVRFAQRHRSVPVFGSELVVALDGAAGVVTAAGKLVPQIDPDVDPAVSPARAQAVARATAGLPAAGRPDLVVLDRALLGRAASSTPALAWRVRVAGPAGPDGRSQTRSEARPETQSAAVFVDAETGEAIASIDLAPAARDRRVCDNGNTPGGAQTCEDPVRTEGGPATGADQADAAYLHLGRVYDFFDTRFDRDGIDDTGGPLDAVVRHCPASPCPYRNAYWDNRTETMVFGDGFVTDDITAHEMAHGITAEMSGLLYVDQSGAINESLSDVFGELVDLATPADDLNVRWLLGEGLPGLGAIRSMSDPLSSRSPQPDSMTSPAYYTPPAGALCDSEND